MAKHDWFDWILFGTQIVSALGGALAVGYAAGTIRESKIQTAKSQQALIRERQIDFQLEVLRELAEFNLKGNNVAWAGSQFKILAAMLPIDLVPLARACVGLPSSPEAENSAYAATGNTSGGPREHRRNEIEIEILQAIERLVAEVR